MRNAFWITLSLAFLLVACRSSRSTIGTTGDALPPEAFAFTIVQLNDVYEISPLDGGRVGGMSRVATVLRALKEENPNTLALLAGNTVAVGYDVLLGYDPRRAKRREISKPYIQPSDRPAQYAQPVVGVVAG